MSNKSTIRWVNHPTLQMRVRKASLRKIKIFLTDERGATIVEYALLAAMLSLTLVISLRDMGGNVVTTFETAEQGFRD